MLLPMHVYLNVCVLSYNFLYIQIITLVNMHSFIKPLVCVQVSNCGLVMNASTNCATGKFMPEPE